MLTKVRAIEALEPVSLNHRLAEVAGRVVADEGSRSSGNNDGSDRELLGASSEGGVEVGGEERVRDGLESVLNRVSRGSRESGDADQALDGRRAEEEKRTGEGKGDASAIANTSRSDGTKDETHQVVVRALEEHKRSESDDNVGGEVKRTGD